MKRLLFGLLLIGALAQTGCLWTFSGMGLFNDDKANTQITVSGANQVGPTEKPVTADQIREDNAHDKINSLSMEMDRDEQASLHIEGNLDMSGKK